MGYLRFDEPFTSLVHQGIILGTDGSRMSKTRGNVISPDKYIEEYGSDVMRVYIGFGFKYTEGGPWSDEGIRSIAKWLDKVERIAEKAVSCGMDEMPLGKEEKELNFVRYNTIKHVTRDYENFDFNTAVARMMELVNALTKYEAEGKHNSRLYRECVLDLIKLLAPLAPHFSEELWQRLGMPYSVFNRGWVKMDETALVRSETEIALQINSKIRNRINVPSELKGKELEEYVLSLQETRELLEGRQVKKIISVPGRLVNIIL